MRDRIKKLLHETANMQLLGKSIEEGVDFLISEGVIVPPCKVGDTVYVITSCENIFMHHDNDYETGTGAVECPFENSCDFEECDDSHIRVVKTYVSGIACEEPFGWRIYCSHIVCAYTFDDFGKFIFCTEKEAEQVLEKLRGE